MQYAGPFIIARIDEKTIDVKRPRRNSRVETVHVDHVGAELEVGDSIYFEFDSDDACNSTQKMID